MTNTESSKVDPTFRTPFLQMLIVAVSLSALLLFAPLPDWLWWTAAVFVVFEVYLAALNLINWRGWFRG